MCFSCNQSRERAGRKAEGRHSRRRCFCHEYNELFEIDIMFSYKFCLILVISKIFMLLFCSAYEKQVEEQVAAAKASAGFVIWSPL
jgi:hypothetical protein